MSTHSNPYPRFARPGARLARAATIAAACCIGVPAWGAAPPAGAPKATAAQANTGPAFDLDDAERIEAGRKRFNRTCAGYCHGSEGSGGRAPSFKGRTDLSEQAAFETIWNGRTGAGVMPPWGGALSDEQIWELVAYLRYLASQPAD